MTERQKHYLYAIVALAIAILLTYLLLSLAEDAQGAPKQPKQSAFVPFVVPERYREDLAALDRRALDAAYTAQISLLYKTWVGDVPTLSHDPTRIIVGLSHNREAWVLARERMEGKR